MPSPRHSTSDTPDTKEKPVDPETPGIEEVTDETATKKDDAPYYCPGCGKRVQYPQQCTGKPESPHQPIEVVSTDELSGDAEGFTAAPSSENLG